MKRPSFPLFLWLAISLGGVGVAGGAEPSPAELDFFEKRIRPVLIEHCYECHSTESKKLKGGLRLDTRAGWLQGGDTGPVLVPGKSQQSALIEAIRYQNSELQMPPKGKLPEAVIADLVRWVDLGAPDPRTGTPAAERTSISTAAAPHWAFQPLRDAAPPAVQSTEVRTPIDRFIAQQLEVHQLGLSPRAAPRTLLRRAALTLTGLPPTPEELTALERDPSPEAFARAVDRLLASPHYGERWARHWLDAARFAESSGFEHDYDRPNAWPYRDYVIHAFNTDQPYAEFVRWQLAGDEFAPDNPWALMATGFLGAGVFPTQITANEVERVRYDALDDMASTAGAAFLGLTVGCARCHDHKFDPIATRDYYRLISAFATTVRSQMDLDLVPEENRQAEQRWEREHAKHLAALKAFEEQEMPARFNRWLESSPRVETPDWLYLELTNTVSAGGATLTAQPDGSLLASGKNPDFDRYTLVARLTPTRALKSLRLEALADPSMVKNGPGRADNGNFALSDFRVFQRSVGSSQVPVPVRLTQPRVTFEQKGLPLAASLDDDAKSGWAVDPEFGKDHAAVFELAEPLDATGEVELTFELKFDTNNRHSIGRLRLSVSTQSTPDLRAPGGPAQRLADVQRALQTPERTAAQQELLRAWQRQQDPEWRAQEARVQDSLKAKPKPVLTPVMVATEGLPALRMHTQGADFFEQTHLLKRGDPNLKGEVVSLGFLPVLMRQPESHWQTPRPEGARTSYRRRALAEWITDPQDGAGVLLARVLVNRVWSLHFGRGLVATPNDFGRQGELPTHPELLDWLAREFLRQGGSIKQLHRLILNSAVWQQSSHATPDRLEAAATVDPENKLWWRFPRHRLEAEAIRDSLLAAAGNLDRRMGGPGSLDEQQVRRSVYFMVKRSQLSRTLQLFDAPDAVLSVGNRPATITAPQALLFLNSPFIRNCAREFGQRLEHAARAATADGIRSGYQLALGRSPIPEELTDSLAFLHDASPGMNSPTSQAWEDFAQVLLGLNEFIYVE
ncbi:MAG: PSD1 domain-containing protein [Verrucomicrobia bacterium]|nr:PSD1 domain-containing protein [Verrucomicrobiota bacterium]